MRGQFLLIGLFLTGCAASPRQGEVEIASPDDGIRQMHISAESLDSELEIRIEIEGDADGMTHVFVPRGASNIQLETEGALFLDIDVEGQKAVAHKASQMLRFRYRMGVEATTESPRIVRGNELWIVPWEVEEWTPTRVTFDLEGITHLPHASSVGGQPIDTIVPRIQRSLHLMGARPTRQTRVAGCKLMLWADIGIEVDLDEISSNARTLLEETKAYWGMELPSQYLVVITGDEISFDHGRARGLAVLQGAVIHSDGAGSRNSVSGPTSVLAHEFQHLAMPWASVHEQIWFSEGFVDYVGEVVALRSGGEPSSYTDEFREASRTFEDLRRSESPEDIYKAKRAAGFLVAHQWAVRYGHEAVRTLLRTAHEDRFNIAELIRHIEDALGSEALAEVEAYVHDMKKFEFDRSEACVKYHEVSATHEGGQVRKHTILAFEPGIECAFWDEMKIR